MILLTVCFFEFPAAKPHIDFWENALKDKIKQKIINDKNCYYYEIFDTNDPSKIREIVSCVPIYHLKEKNGFGILDLFHDKYNTRVLKYNKTLIFGKVEIEDLTKIKQLINFIN